MMRKLAIALVLYAGCAGDPSDVVGGPQKIAVVDTYEKDFAFETPVPCKLLLHRRITDDEARYVEYDARIGDTEVRIFRCIKKLNDIIRAGDWL